MGWHPRLVRVDALLRPLYRSTLGLRAIKKSNKEGWHPRRVGVDRTGRVHASVVEECMAGLDNAFTMSSGGIPWWILSEKEIESNLSGDECFYIFFNVTNKDNAV